MDNNIAMLVGGVPAILVVLATLILRHASPEETVARRTLIFLEGVTLAILCLQVGFQWLPEPLRNQMFWFGTFSIPVLAVLAMLILVNLPSLRSMDQKSRWIIIILGMTIIGMMVYLVRATEVLFYAAPAFLIFAGVDKTLNRKPGQWVWAWLVLTAAILIWVNLPASQQVANLALPLAYLKAMIMIAFPVVSAATVALLVHAGIQHFQFAPDGLDLGDQKLHHLEGMLQFAAATLILAYYLYTVIWICIWDSTRDGLGGVLILLLGIPAAIVCGALMVYRANDRNRMAGIGFSVIMPVLVLTAFNIGWGVSFQDLTDQRAAQIAQALERYYQREGVYPQSLSDLAPRDLLFVPSPVIFQSENWCYQAASNAYRLVAFYREYWGLPVSLRVYASAGSLDGQPLPCEERLAEMKKRYDPPPLSNELSQIRATPQPIGHGQPLPYTGSLQPLVSIQTDILPGVWSPDGSWWFFRTVNSNAQTAIYHFYNAETKQFCQTGPEIPYSVYNDLPPEWLPPGRLLAQDSNENLYQIEPCKATSTPFLVQSGLRLGQRKAVDSVGGKILLQSENAYWLFNPEQENPVRIHGIQTNTSDSRRDRAAWSPTGKRLALIHATSLYLVDGTTGQVLVEEPLGLLNNQSNPWIDWVSSEELLLQGPQVMILMDFRGNPPLKTDVMKDIFHLNLSIPDQISSTTDISSRDGTHYSIAIRANHPRNQNIYVYNSQNKQVAVLEPTTQAILLFPDGQWQELTSLEPIQLSDTFEIFRVDSNQPGPLKIQIDGHQPRNYPQLGVAFFPQDSQLLAISSRGISALSLPSGNLLNFWQVGSGKDIDPYFVQSPDGQTLLAVVNGEGIYQIPAGH